MARRRNPRTGRVLIVHAVWVNRHRELVVVQDERPQGEGWRQSWSTNPEATARKFERAFAASRERRRLKRTTRGVAVRCFTAKGRDYNHEIGALLASALG